MPKDIPFTNLGMTEKLWDVLGILAEDSRYWKSAKNFLEYAKDMKSEALSLPQKNWIVNIIADLEEKCKH